MTKGTEVLLLGKLHEKVLPEDRGQSTEVVCSLVVFCRWCRGCQNSLDVVVEGIHLALGR